MTEQEFYRIVNFMKKRNGVDLSKKKIIVKGRLDNYLRECGYSSYSAYMDAVDSDYTGEMAQNLVDILTTNHTYFMREFEHFTFFKNTILPELKEIHKTDHDLRIWSAACSSGEEPYMIEMVIKDFLGFEYNDWETTILATDISKKVLDIAHRGIYNEEKLQEMPQVWVRNYFKRIDEENYRVVDDIRKRVLFRQFNLMNQLVLKKQMDVIFLRNVMIYFDEDTKKQLLTRMHGYLKKGGYLIIGSTESITSYKSQFLYIRPSIYRRI